MTGDRLIIKDLRLRGIIGLNDWEREEKQDIVINIVLVTDIRPAAAHDDATGLLNYRSVAKDVIRHVEGSSYRLVEAMATAIARICVVDHGALGVLVRVEKPGALRFAASAGVEIERTRADFAG